MRVVSLLPSATEICYALGVEPVGVSHECDWPPEAAEKPAINRSRVDPDAASAEINEQVARAESEGGVYEIKVDTLADLDPDVVVTQGVCDVCAVDTLLVEDAIAQAGIDAEVVTSDVHSLADLYADIERLGAVFDREARAADLVAELRERVAAVESRVASRVSDDDRPSVAVFDWLDPVMVAGHWIPELVDIAGGTYPLADPGDRSTPREWASVREADPDVVVAAPCGFGLDQALDARTDLTDRPGWAELSAVESGDVYAMDGHHYVNRPGPRLVDTLEHLAGLLHPEAFDDPPGDVARTLPGRPTSADGPPA